MNTFNQSGLQKEEYQQYPNSHRILSHCCRAYEEIKSSMREEILSRLDFTREIPDEEVRDLIDQFIAGEGKKYSITLDERLRLRRELFYSIRKLDLLQDLIDEPANTEIMINGTEGIYLEQKGKMIRHPMNFQSKEKLEDVIQQIVSGCNRTVNEASPIVDARLENGSRVNIVLSPVALNGPIVTIRRFPDKPIGMKELIALGAITGEAADFMERLVKGRYNILISGGTGSGKTTFLNALSKYIPEDERIITIEDNAELQITEIENLVRLETRNANVEGCKEITIRDLIKTSLRMRPDRIIVGEVRGAEAIDMIQCLNTGHDGSMSTGHANSCIDLISRLETMILMGMEIPLMAVKKQIASAVDIIVQLARVRDKTRKVMEIAEVTGYENGEITLSVLYRFEETEEYVTNHAVFTDMENEFQNSLTQEGGNISKMSGKKMSEAVFQKVHGKLIRKEKLLHDEKLKAAGLPTE